MEFMHRYFSRICWYVGLILILVGFFYLPIPMITVAFLSALACYFPTSLLWIFLSRLFIYFESDMRYPSERTGFIIMLIGVLMVASCYFFPNIDWASFAILIMLAGGDWIFSFREEKSLLEDKVKSIRTVSSE
jgi:peptidoglycan/LPS O-acetylase OafA/YrhL